MLLVRAGLGLVRLPAVSFVYANPDETVALLRSDVVHDVGQSLEVLSDIRVRLRKADAIMAVMQSIRRLEDLSRIGYDTGDAQIGILAANIGNTGVASIGGINSADS